MPWTKSHENTNKEGQKESSSKWAVQYQMCCWVFTSKSTMDTLFCVHSNFHPKNRVIESQNHLLDGTSKNLHVQPYQTKSRCSRLCQAMSPLQKSTSEWEILFSLGNPTSSSQSKTIFFNIKSDFPMFQLVLNVSCSMFLPVAPGVQ